MLQGHRILNCVGHELLLAVHRRRVIGDMAVGPVRLELAGTNIICKTGVQNVMDFFFDPGIVDRTRNLHPALGIAGHKIGRGNVDLFRSTGAETVDPGMLQIPSDNASNMKVFCFAGDTGQNAADAADDHGDLNACHGRIPKLFHQVHIRYGVQLQQNSALISFLNFLVNQGKQRRFQGYRRDQKVLVGAVQVADHHIFKEGVGVAADGLICCQQGQVCVDRGGLFVVVTGPNLGDVADIAVLPPGDQADF